MRPPILGVALLISAMLNTATAQVSSSPAVRSVKPGATSAKTQVKPAQAATPLRGLPLPQSLLIGGSDNCATPDVISGSGPFSFNNTAATTGSQGQSEGLCLAFGQTAIANDVWFRWTASSTGTATLSLCLGTGIDSKVAVYAGSGCPLTPALACNDDTCGLQSLTQFPCINGQQYTIQLGNYLTATGGSGAFTINVNSAPSNDNCSTPATLIGAGPYPYDNSQATTGAQGQSEAACLYLGATSISNDIWYVWTANFTGTAQLSLCGGTMDSKVAVYAGAGCPSSPALACNDDACGYQSSLAFAATSGSLYTIQLGNYFNASGSNGVFTLGPLNAPSNDDCATPILLVGCGPFNFDNTNTSTGAQGQLEGDCLFFGTTGITNDLWYTWTAQSSGPVTISFCAGTTLDSKVAVYAGAGCPTGPAVGCDDDGCGTTPGPSLVTFTAAAGTTYTIQVGNFPTAVGGAGAFEFTAGCGPPGVDYCFPGQAGVIVCPCGNPGNPGAGCNNSANTGGAILTSSGAASLANDTLQFTASGEKPTALSIFLQGTLTLGTGIGFGQGVRCVAGPLKRLFAHNAVAGVVVAPVGGDPSVSVRSAALGDVIVAGTSRYYQTYYRDPTVLGGCSPFSTFNVTQAESVVWSP